MLEEIQRFYSTRETQYLTHSFHPYPNKMVPQIARALVKKYSKQGEVVLDPFCGSGTTLVEASLLGRKAVGVDINPLACLITKAKTMPLQTSELKSATKKLLEDLYSNLRRNGSLKDYVDKTAPKIPDFPKKECWFQKSALEGLGVLKELISGMEDENTRDFCQVAFSSIIKDCSNASSLYRLTRLKKPKNITRLHVAHKFREKISKMTRGLHDFGLNLKGSSNHVEIYQQDSKFLWGLKKVDLVITKPPSFNLEFLRCFKIYFWWLDLGDIKKLNQKRVGTKKTGKELAKLNIGFADEIIERIREKKERAARALSKYYYELRVVTNQLHGLLREEGCCCINCSDFVLYGNHARVPDTLMELARQSGFKLERRLKRVVPKKSLVFASKDKIEEVLVFKKN